MHSWPAQLTDTNFNFLLHVKFYFDLFATFTFKLYSMCLIVVLEFLPDSFLISLSILSQRFTSNGVSKMGAMSLFFIITFVYLF